MNGADMLALARYTASHILQEHGPQWEDMPLLDESDAGPLLKSMLIVRLQLAEQAGPRGRELWEATQ